MGATLMMHTLLRLQTTTPGFEPEGVLTASITLPQLKYPNAEQRIALYRTLLDRLTALPGVQAASMVSLIPFGGSNTGLNLLIEGQPPPRPEETPNFWRRIVDPRYFRVMRFPLIRGREFSEQDAILPRTAIINETRQSQTWC
jgi:putative ABC transport system permease protein